MRQPIGSIARAIGLVAIAAALTAAATGLVLAAPGYGHGMSGAKSVRGGSQAAEVLERVKVGTYIEDVTYIRSGPHANHIAFVDGYAVRAIPANAHSDKAIKTLFDVRAMDFTQAVRGFEWIASERLFAFLDAGQPTVLFLTDHNGNAQPSRVLRYPDGFEPEWVDGLAYIPPDAAVYPDHLVVVANAFDEALEAYRPHFVVVRRDGQAVADVPLPESLISGFGVFAYGVSYVAPGRLLASLDAQLVWLDFTGNLSDPIVPIDGVGDGLAQIGDGRIVVSNGATLEFRDAQLNRTPQDDRDAGTGAGLIYPQAVMWDSRYARLDVLAYAEASGGNILDMRIAGLSPRLDGATTLVDLGSAPALARVRGATLVPDEDRFAVMLRRASPAPVEIAFYDRSGAVIERLPLTAALAGVGAPYAVGYLGDTREFAICASFLPDTLRIVDRVGTFVRDIDFSGAGVAGAGMFAYLPPTASRGARFVVADFLGATRAVVTDADGALLSEFDYRAELGIVEPGGITPIASGRWAGAFAMVDNGTAELVVFRVRGLSP